MLFRSPARFVPLIVTVDTTVTIKGTNLAGATEVTFNGTSAGAPIIMSATLIKAVVPAGATTGSISVVTPNGTATSTGLFKVLPKITGFTPGIGVAGASVTISGFNFTGATRAMFGKVPASSFTVDSDTQITATVPASAPTLAVSSTQIDLTWKASTDNVGVTGYQLVRCEGTGCSTFTQIAAPTGTTYSDTVLSPSTSYSYQARATDAADNVSVYSNTATATTTP